MEDLICCEMHHLPSEQQTDAARLAVMRSPVNRPNDRLCDLVLDEQHIALLTTRYWGAAGVDLGVCFLDTQERALQERILAHMNAWGEHANVLFRQSNSPASPIRIARTPRGGYWSNLGTDCLLVPVGQPTMNLDSFTMSTPESEYRRAVRHEAGHAIGMVHEHLRKSMIERIDKSKALAYYLRTQGWTEDMTRRNVLTAPEEAALMGSAPEATSVMCYHIPAEITVDGVAIEGGRDITPHDHAEVGKLYPKPAKPPPAQILVIEFSGGYRILP